MTKHPELDLCGHGCCEEEMGQKGCDNGTGEYVLLNCTSLLHSNRLATRTVMLKRMVQYRFKEGKRYAEDYLLWLQMACDGLQIALLDNLLAYTYKAPYGVSGLSANLWRAEKGELEAFCTLVVEKRIGVSQLISTSAYSLMKHFRRVFLVWERRWRSAAHRVAK